MAAVTDNDFSVSIIPHTLSETILSEKRSGDIVNLENDMIGKYIEKLMFGNADKNKAANSNIDMGFLTRNGFL